MTLTEAVFSKKWFVKSDDQDTKIRYFQPDEQGPFDELCSTGYFVFIEYGEYTFSTDMSLYAEELKADYLEIEDQKVNKRAGL